MRTTLYERLTALLADDAWHSEDELSEVVRFPQPWVRELAAEGRIEVRSEGARLTVRRCREVHTA
jgi:hypothetical protein